MYSNKRVSRGVDDAGSLKIFYRAVVVVESYRTHIHTRGCARARGRARVLYTRASVWGVGRGCIYTWPPCREIPINMDPESEDRSAKMAARNTTVFTKSSFYIFTGRGVTANVTSSSARAHTHTHTYTHTRVLYTPYMYTLSLYVRTRAKNVVVVVDIYIVLYRSSLIHIIYYGHVDCK